MKVLLAGFGAVGQIRHSILQNINDRNLEIIGISDQEFDKVYQQNTRAEVFRDFREMIENLSANCLFIALPNHLAVEATLLGLKKNMHVFCEKPPARNLKELDIILKNSSLRKKQILMYGFNHRFHPSVKMAKQIIMSGELGEIVNFKAEYGKSAIIKYENSEWRANHKFSGGGILLDQGIHMLDLLRFFGGEFEPLASLVSNSFWNYDVEDNAYALLVNSNKIPALIHSSATLWKHSFRIEIGMTLGSILLSGILSSTKSYGSETITIYKKKTSSNRIGEEITYKFEDDISWQEEITNFFAAIDQVEHTNLGNIQEAQKTLELVEKIYFKDENWASFLAKQH